MAKVALILEAKAASGRRDDLRAVWDEHLRRRAEANDAQELYLYCYDDEDPDLVRIVEVYGDRESVSRNAGADWFADYMRATGPLLAGPPRMATAIPVWAKGLPL